jgi:hypothetical protein
MANPTSSFGWQMPTPSDLVTDLPADFEVFGQAVDTDLADLLGGTTGQVLSKTSGTDLAFTWIAQDATLTFNHKLARHTLSLSEMLENLSPHRTPLRSRSQFRHLFSQPETSLTFNQ